MHFILQETLCPNAVHAYTHYMLLLLSAYERIVCVPSVWEPGPFLLVGSFHFPFSHMIPFPLSTNTVTTVPTTTTRKIIQNAQHMYVRCLLFLCWLSNHVSLCDASAVMVVQNLKLLLGRPDSDMPKLSLEPLGFFEKRFDVRFEEDTSGAKVVLFGVGGREGGWLDSANLKRLARREARLEGGVSAASAKCVERGVEGREGACVEGAVAY
jgi:hypothetical protein